MRNNKFWKKSFISLFLSLAMAVLFVGNVFLSTVYAVDFGFQEIRGITDQWPTDITGRENDFSNTLSMNFEATKVNSNYMKAGVWFNYEKLENYRKRIENFPNDRYKDMGYFLEGWIWNTNIGWISTSCEDWEKYDKAFADWCKNFSYYKVYMTTPKNGEAYLRGYAWSPKVGWLLFHYADEQEKKPVVYKGTDEWVKNVPKIKITDGNKKGTLSGYAWNDKIGYFSLNGATIDFTGMNSCVDPYLEFSEGYDYAVCPKQGDPYEYKHSATLKCKLGNPMLPYDYSRVDTDNDPPNFNIFNNGKIEWTLTDKTFSGCGIAKTETVAQIKVSNKDVFGDVGQELIEDIKIKLLDKCKVKFDESVFKFYDINGSTVEEVVYKNAYVNSEYYYKIEIPESDWTAPIDYSLVKAPEGMTIVKASDNSAILKWDPSSEDLGKSYDVSIKAKNCNPTGFTRSYKITVQGKAPSTLTSCPKYWFVEEPYKCESIVDLNEADKASTPLTWSITESSSAMPEWTANNLEVVFDDNSLKYESSDRKAGMKVVNGDNSSFVAIENMMNKTFSFKYEVTNDYVKDESQKKFQDILVTVVSKEMAIPPEIAQNDENFYHTTIKPITREYTLKNGAPVDKMSWTASKTGGNGSVVVSPVIGDKVIVTYNPTDNDEGKKINIETKVNNDAEQLFKNNYKTWCTTCLPPIEWYDTVLLNNLELGYMPSINVDNVSRDLKFKFIKGEESTFDLNELTRQGDIYRSKKNDDSVLPISGTPKNFANNVSLAGFKNWVVSYNGKNVGTIGSNGIWKWKPDVSGKIELSMGVWNDFGSRFGFVEVEVGEAPKFAESSLDLKCNEGVTINKDIIITNAYPELIKEWGIESLDTNLDGGVVNNDNNGTITVFNDQDYKLTLSYVKNPELPKDTWEARLQWKCAVGAEVKPLEFDIKAVNDAGIAILPVNIDVTPIDEVVPVNDILVENLTTVKVGDTAMIKLEAVNGIAEFIWSDLNLINHNLNGTAWNIYSNPSNFGVIQTGINVAYVYFTPTQQEYDFQKDSILEQIFRFDISVTDKNNNVYNLLSDKFENNYSKLPKIKILPAISDAPELWSEKLAQNFGGTVSMRTELFGGTSTSIGSPQTDISRDVIFGNVLALKRGVKENTNTSAGTIYSNNNKLDKSDTVGVSIDSGNILFYENVDVNIDNFSNDPLDWKGHQTIVVYGGNLFIKDNLWPSDSNKGTLDIVVLRKPGGTRGKSGNILVDNDVTNIKANIYADGALFSYDADDFDKNYLITNGYPDYMSKNCTPQSGKYSEYMNCMDGDASDTMLKNQFKLLGSLNSRNTLGKVKQSGTDFDTSLLVNGYGQKITDLAEALAYDLAYFRFYHLNYGKNALCGDGKAEKFSGTCTELTALDVTDQKVCRGIGEKSAYVDNSNQCKNKSSITSNENDAVIIEYLPYSPESKVFKMSGGY
ncbi:MAG: hypothetical protein UR27_C0012G0011 [Candidatus Peregrinibacteria bacterium GW2011_GWA2_33_10]|nr:MAG: hypothetical protein UR27_C0012G0011 [Candidatus Peregrinibacteria bacterium GW2011_GWA2_33_10]KKP40944.1 MAG: hypothetical protein UR30_C0003G0116 [Candidatus Peregrinibacteria bacterium GW2011_GWC2_33_13]